MNVIEKLTASILGRRSAREQAAAARYERLIEDILADRVGDGAKEVERVEEILAACGLTPEQLEGDVALRKRRAEGAERARKLPALDAEVKALYARIRDYDAAEERRRKQWLEHRVELEGKLGQAKSRRIADQQFITEVENESGPLGEMVHYHNEDARRKAADEADALAAAMHRKDRDAWAPLRAQLATLNLRRQRGESVEDSKLSSAERAVEVANREEADYKRQLADARRRAESEESVEVAGTAPVGAV